MDHHKIEYRQLQAFHAVVETRSMTAAAKILGVSQPAVSSLISRLEQELRLRLFIREKGTLKPTQDAVALCGSVSQIIAGFRNVHATVDALYRGTGGRLLISAQPLVGLSILPEIIAGFRQANPEVTVRLQTTTSAAVKHAISGGLYDLGIATVPLDTPSMRLHSFRAPCVCLLPKGHPLTSSKEITPKLLDGVPFVGMMPERFIHHLIGRAFSEARAEWNVVCETDFFAVAAEIVAHGDCVTVTDPFTARQFRDQVDVRAFSPQIDYEFALYRHPERELSATAQKFADLFCTLVGSRSWRRLPQILE